MNRSQSSLSSAFFVQTALVQEVKPKLLLLILCTLLSCGCQRQEKAGSNEDRKVQTTSSEVTSADSRSLNDELMADAHYVNDQQCAECHQSIYDSYQHVGMARSFYDFDPDNTVEDFENAHYYHKLSDNHYEVAIVDGKLQQTRYKLRGDGKKVHQHSVSARYVVGSGNHVRTYLNRNENGEMFQLPVVWYSQDKKWGMAPGYDSADHPDFSRPIFRDCMSCHNAYPELSENGDSFGMPHRFPEKLPQGIGCQRCHGPGSEHVRIANQADTTRKDELQQVLFSIVSSKRLSNELQDDVCNQCHLQPSSRRSSFVRKFGKRDFGFRPGQSLKEHMTFLELDHDNENANVFEINHHPYRLKQSLCFSKTPDGIRCTHCHDPHKKVSPDEQAQYYRQKCYSCHGVNDCLNVEQGRAADADCISCHMPERRTEDVIHVTMTDHRIARRPSLPDPVAALTEQAIPVDIPMRSFNWKKENTSSDQADTRLYELFSMLKDDNEFALQPFYDELIQSKNQTVEPKMLAIQKLLQYKQFEKVETIYESLSDQQRSLNVALVNAGISKLGLKQYDEAQQLLEQATDSAPENPEAWHNLGVLHSRIGNSELALDCLERAIKLRPSYVKPQIKVGSLFALDDRLAESATQLRKVLELDTRNIETYRKLSSVLRLSGKWDAAVAILKDGLAIAPNNIELTKAAALTLLETDNSVANDIELLLRTTENWIATAPESSEARILHSIALSKNNRASDSHEHLNHAIQIGERKPEAGLVLAMAQHIAGSKKPAMENYNGAKKAILNRPRDRTARIILENVDQYFSESK